MTNTLKTIAAGLEESYPLTAQYISGIFGLAKKLSFQMSINQSVDTYEDFFQVMLLEACKLEAKFDKGRGTSFYTFINRPLKAKAFTEFVPVDKTSEVYKNIHQFVKYYSDKHNTYPQVSMIADGLEITEEKVKTIYYGKHQQVSLDALSEDFVSELEESREINPLDYLEHLDDVEATVISLLYGDIPEDTAETFAMNYLCITRGALQNIHERALGKLKEAIDKYE